LQYLVARAGQENTTEVGAAEVIGFVSALGASPSQTLTALRALAQYSLIRDLEAHEISASSTVAVTRSGAYYARALGHTMVYVEQVMMDTAIFDRDTWDVMSSLTDAIERERSPGDRMRLRADRLASFTQYLVDIEAEELTFAPSLANLTLLAAWKASVTVERRGLCGALRGSTLRVAIDEPVPSHAGPRSVAMSRSWRVMRPACLDSSGSQPHLSTRTPRRRWLHEQPVRWVCCQVSERSGSTARVSTSLRAKRPGSERRRGRALPRARCRRRRSSSPASGARGGVPCLRPSSPPSPPKKKR
jgi:hypothetical protein